MALYAEIFTQSSDILRFADGLNFLGLLDEMKLYPNAFKKMFTYNKSSLTALTLIDDILADIRYSPVGSNARLMENEVVSWWRDYVFEVEGILLNGFKPFTLLLSK